ncbi:MAG: hypothetical protein JNL58_07190 [Planctomyces sp.]|nr:hypothetical protein [Planctomyces sp.]
MAAGMQQGRLGQECPSYFFAIRRNRDASGKNPQATFLSLRQFLLHDIHLDLFGEFAIKTEQGIDRQRRELPVVD